jgi:hypothetical protein
VGGSVAVGCDVSLGTNVNVGGRLVEVACSGGAEQAARMRIKTIGRYLFMVVSDICHSSLSLIV